MSLRKRLLAVENGATSETTLETVLGDANYAAALIAVLLATGRLFWPVRLPTVQRQAITAIHERRALFRTAGVPWATLGARGGSAASWKRSQRTRDALAAAGAIELKTHRNTPHIRLSARALAAIRQAIGLPGLGERARLHWVAAGAFYREAEPDCRPNGWVSEALLFGCDYSERPHPSDWFDLEAEVLPLLIDGALESTSTATGHIFYRATGTDFVGAEEAGSGAINQRLQALYAAHWEIDSRAGWVPDDLAAIHIPLSETR